MAKATTHEATKPSKVERSTTKRTAGALAEPIPSAELAANVGAVPLPRTEVVPKDWDHIRAHGLQDPADKRTIVADAKLRAVFGKGHCTMSEMQKLLSPHLTAA